jgi:hypothetical protein
MEVSEFHAKVLMISLVPGTPAATGNTRIIEVLLNTRVYPKVSGLSCIWYYSLRSNTKGYGGKTH